MRHDNGEAVDEPGRRGPRVPAPHGRSHGRLPPARRLPVLLRSGGGGDGAAARAPH